MEIQEIIAQKREIERELLSRKGVIGTVGRGQFLRYLGMKNK